jgi:cytochrome P450
LSAASAFTREELTNPAFFNDPYPFYARLREHREPFWLPHQQDTSSGGIWLFSRYDDAVAIFKQVAGVTKNLRSVRPEGFRLTFDANLLLRDGAVHLRLRRLVSDYFSTESVERLRPVMVSIADELITKARSNSEFCFVADVAEPMPLHVIASIVGIPAPDLQRVRAWSLILSAGFDSLLSDVALLARQKQAMDEFFAYVEHQIEAKRSNPDDSMLSALIDACGKHLDHEELAAMVGFLLFAGHETTVSLLGSLVWLLLSHPEQWALVRRQPELVRGAVEEALRFESPTQRTSFRLVNEPVTINGHTCEPGQQIGVIIGSANRDEAAFERADQFDISRNPNKHIAFGLGLHNCLGKGVARMEAEVCLEVLLNKMPGLVPRSVCPPWRRNSFFRGLHSLPVAVGGKQ